ncbi:universal stress protein [Siccirubricoccus sp. G192]|uniref:universal stress protein n=1 Tax=Siccirubricoccus sp. G192 TaxID=2849651 RepID=UPI0020C32AC8|nr:universal stress protein [Siccirubricoccus sp. G192]
MASGGEWRLVEGMTAEQVTLHARCADLLVVGQEDPDGGPPFAGPVLERALFSSGRPVLVVPHAGRFETVGRRVLLGWNASREAARAANDALPLMADAEVVTVLAVNFRRDQDGYGDAAESAEPGSDIALHFARHGLKAEVQHAVAPGLDAGDMLLNQAADLSADLLVVGAYGHSRFREMVLGGVTRTLLRQMTVPVLMSH